MQRSARNVLPKVLVGMVVVTLCLLLLLSHTDWRVNSKSQGLVSQYSSDESRSVSPRTDESGKQASDLTRTKEISKSVDDPDRQPAGGNPFHTRPTKNDNKADQKKYLESSRKGNKFKATYPAWFLESWDRSRTTAHLHEFVGDKPLFEPCEKNPDTRKYKFPMIEPKDYIAKSRNPCWFDDPARQRGFRCLPYFYIAGVAKCGTTDLYRRIRLHPNIMKGTMKEYHFWDRERFGSVEPSEDGEVLQVMRKPWSFEQYTDQVTGPRDLKLAFDDLKYEGFSVRLFGDGSPSYLWDIQNWDLLEGNNGCLEPRIVLGQHIRHVYPDAKMILIFRHPTPRQYSRFLSRIWRTPYLKGATSQDFHNYVVNGVRLYKDCFSRMSMRQCVYNFTIYDEAVVRLVEGMYPVFMADWLRVWPREQMLLLRNEDYGQDVNGTMDKVFDFLGVEPVTGEKKEELMGHDMVNVGSEYETVGPMKPETVKILDEFFQPFVNKFAELLQEERFLWKDTYPPPPK